MPYKYPRTRQAIIDFIKATDRKVHISHILIHLAKNHEETLSSEAVVHNSEIQRMQKGGITSKVFKNMLKSIRRYVDCEQWGSTWWYGSGPLPTDVNNQGIPRSAPSEAAEKNRAARKEAARMIAEHTRAMDAPDSMRPHLERVILHLEKIYRVN